MKTVFFIRGKAYLFRDRMEWLRNSTMSQLIRDFSRLSEFAASESFADRACTISDGWSLWKDRAVGNQLFFFSHSDLFDYIDTVWSEHTIEHKGFVVVSEVPQARAILEELSPLMANLRRGPVIEVEEWRRGFNEIESR